nr:MAG TPA: hypothetical protein [Caudoviricetes sp.]
MYIAYSVIRLDIFNFIVPLTLHNLFQYLNFIPCGFHSYLFRNS